MNEQVKILIYIMSISEYNFDSWFINQQISMQYFECMYALLNNN